MRSALAFLLGSLVTYLVLRRPKPRPEEPAVVATLAFIEGGSLVTKIPLVGVKAAKFNARFKNTDGRNRPIFSPEAYLTDASLATVTMEIQPDLSYDVTVTHTETPGAATLVVKGRPIEDSDDVIQASGDIEFVDGAATLVELGEGVLIPE